MKLRNSRTEQEYRAQLIKSNYSLFNVEENREFLKILKGIYPQIRTAYIIHWIPEQGEDFYRILINDNIIAKIELDHDYTREPIVENLTIPEYVHGLRMQDQIQLAVALDLARKDLESNK